MEVSRGNVGPPGRKSVTKTTNTRLRMQVRRTMRLLDIGIVMDTVYLGVEVRSAKE